MSERFKEQAVVQKYRVREREWEREWKRRLGKVEREKVEETN